jgi:hypothetical protein
MDQLLLCSLGFLLHQLSSKSHTYFLVGHQDHAFLVKEP